MISSRRACARIVVAASLAMTVAAGIEYAQAAGALAVGQCGAYGLAFDHTQFDAASAAALGKCSGTCQVVTAMKRDCAAFAIDGHNACGAFGYAARPRLGEAQNTALKLCYQYGGKDCVIRAWVCDAKG
jgi:hypothetical protein